MAIRCPNADTITTDIIMRSASAKGRSPGGQYAVIVGEDPNYEIDAILANTTAPYATIHRIAISN